MPRQHTTKQLAARVDSEYIARPHGLRSARWLLIVIAAATAIAWLGLHARRSDETVFMPGKLSSAHALKSHSCNDCHVGTTAGAFNKNVTDDACLKCHFAAVHHPKQTTLAAADPAHGPDALRSANCTSCHSEHRGMPALAALNDAHCLQCHGDLKNHTKDAAPVVQASIVKFVYAKENPPHPEFGRSLMKDGQPHDKTQLKFNHAFHRDHVNMKDHASIRDCFGCHSTANPVPLVAMPRPENDPPFATAKDGTLRGGGERRYMQPISFDRNCRGCHPLNIVPGAGNDVAHEDLALVRAQLRDLPRFFAEKAAADPKLVGSTAQTGRGPRAKPTASLEGWVSGKVANAMTRLDADASSPGFKALKQSLESAGAATTQPTDAGFPSLAEYHVAYLMDNRCSKCHVMTGEISAPSTQAASGAVGAQSNPLRTLPTGIPSSPRRWFVNSTFDHDAHRNILCTDCHSQVLSAGLGPTTKWSSDWSALQMREWDTAQIRESARLLMPGIQQCTDCHRAATASVDAAPASCVTCHNFHDRKREPAQKWDAPK